MGWGLRLSDKTVGKFAELPICCQHQKCSPGNVVSGSISFMQIFAGVRWRGGIKWEWCHWKWRFSLHSFALFRTFYIHGHATAFRWYNCQWSWAYCTLFTAVGGSQQGHYHPPRRVLFVCFFVCLSARYSLSYQKCRREIFRSLSCGRKGEHVRKWLYSVHGGRWLKCSLIMVPTPHPGFFL